MFAVPDKNIDQLHIEPNQIIADFGAGSGAYTIAASKALGETGKVYAVEVQKDLLATLQNTCTREHLGNVSYVWGDIEVLGGTKLRDGSCDLVIISNVLFQADEKKNVIEEARRVLRQGGRLLLIDWTASFNNMGPTADQIFTEHEAKDLVISLNFTFEKSISAGNFHYGMVFRKGLYQPTTPEAKIS